MIHLLRSVCEHFMQGFVCAFRPCWETFNYLHIPDYHHEFALVTHMSFVSHVSPGTLTHVGSSIISCISAAVLMQDIHRGLSYAAGLPSSALSSGTTTSTWCLGLKYITQAHKASTSFSSQRSLTFLPLSYLAGLFSPVISTPFNAYQSARSPADLCFCP